MIVARGTGPVDCARVPRDPEPIPRRVFSIHPPWWARGFTLLALAALLWLLFVRGPEKQYGAEIFDLVPAPPSGWRVADIPPPPTAITVFVWIETDRTLLWSRSSVTVHSTILWTQPTATPADLPFSDEVAASAWLAAEAQGTPFAFQRRGLLPELSVLRGIFRSLSEGRRKHVEGDWAYFASFAVLPGAWFLAIFAVVAGVARLARRLWLERRVRLIDAGFCIHCLYNLKGVPATAACPECGRFTQPVLRKALDELGMRNQA